MDGCDEVMGCFVDLFFVSYLAHGHDVIDPSSVFIVCPYVSDCFSDCVFVLGGEPGEAEEEGGGVRAVKVMRFEGNVGSGPYALGEDKVGCLL